MGDNRTQLSPAELAARLDRVAALLRDPTIRLALELLDEATEADREHGRAQRRRRDRAARLAREAGQDIALLEDLRSVRHMFGQAGQEVHHG